MARAPFGAGGFLVCCLIFALKWGRRGRVGTPFFLFYLLQIAGAVL